MKIISKNFPCESLQALKENFSSVDVLKEFLNGNLEAFLQDLEAPEFFKVAKLDKNLPLQELAYQLLAIFKIQLSEEEEKELKEFLGKSQLAKVRSLEIRFLSEAQAYFAGELSTLPSIKAIEDESEKNPLAALVFGKSEEVRENLTKFLACIENFSARDNFLTLQIKEIKEFSLYDYLIKLNNYKDIRALEAMIATSKKEKFEEAKEEFKQDFDEEKIENLAQNILKTLVFGSLALFTSAASEALFDLDELLDEASVSFSDFLNSLDF